MGSAIGTRAWIGENTREMACVEKHSENNNGYVKLNCKQIILRALRSCSLSLKSGKFYKASGISRRKAHVVLA